MQLFCNALIVELQDGRTILSALVVHEKDLTLDQKRMLEKIGADAKKSNRTEYNISTPNDKVHIIVME